MPASEKSQPARVMVFPAGGALGKVKKTLNVSCSRCYQALCFAALGSW